MINKFRPVSLWNLCFGRAPGVFMYGIWLNLDRYQSGKLLMHFISFVLAVPLEILFY